MSQSTEMTSATLLEPARPRVITGNAPTFRQRRPAAGNDPAPAKPAAGASEHGPRVAESPSAAVPAADAVSTEWPTSYELYLAARTHRAFVLGEIAAAIFDALASAARRLLAGYRQQRKAAAAREALHQLDDRTLHDIGLDRSEIASITAEVMGQAERSRLLRGSAPEALRR